MGSKGTAVKCEVRSENEMSQPQLSGNSVGIWLLMIWLLIITMLFKAAYQLWLKVQNNSAENKMQTIKYV